MSQSLCIGRIPNRTIVTREYEDSVFGKLMLLKPSHNLADHIVDHHDEVAIHTGITLTRKFTIGEPWSMRCG